MHEIFERSECAWHFENMKWKCSLIRNLVVFPAEVPHGARAPVKGPCGYAALAKTLVLKFLLLLFDAIVRAHAAQGSKVL
jgi:hypothetical protein